MDDGRDFLALGAEELRQTRRDIQFIFQDPYSSLNPHMTVAQIISETWVVVPDMLPKKAGRDRAENRFDVNRTAAALSSIYDEQLSTKR